MIWIGAPVIQAQEVDADRMNEIWPRIARDLRSVREVYFSSVTNSDVLGGVLDDVR